MKPGLDTSTKCYEVHKTAFIGGKHTINSWKITGCLDIFVFDSLYVTLVITSTVF